MQIMATLRCTLPPSTTERQSSSGSSPTISVPMWPTVTALMRAADNGHTGPARLLLAHGADCTIKNMASPHIRILLSTHSLLVSAPYKLLLFAMLGLGIVADFRVLAFFLSLWFNLIAEASIFQHAASSVVLTKLSVSLSDEIDQRKDSSRSRSSIWANRDHCTFRSSSSRPAEHSVWREHHDYSTGCSGPSGEV
eukprot:m.117362 g.117362  ORF g.117362 m.117362 type:complete len:195 (+) comp51970_c0_seq1:122-706(+)